MKYSLTLLLGAVLSLGALPSTSQAVEVVVVAHPGYHHAHPHHVYRHGYWIWRHGRHIHIPGHWTTVWY